MGGAGLVALAAAWVHWTESPFVPPTLLRQPRFIAAVLTGAVSNGARFGSVVLVPILLTEITGASPLVIGGVLIPGAAALAVLSPVAGRLADRIGPRWVVLPGVSGIAVTNLTLVWGVDRGAGWIAVILTLAGASFAFIQPPLLGLLGSVVPRAAQGVGNGLYLMVFFLGGAFGVAGALALLGAQDPGRVAVVASVQGPVARYANTMLALAGLAALALPAAMGLPGRAVAHQGSRPQGPEASIRPAS